MRSQLPGPVQLHRCFAGFAAELTVASFCFVGAFQAKLRHGFPALTYSLVARARLSGSLEPSTNQAIQALLNTATMKAPCPPPHGCYNLTFVGAKIPSLLDQVRLALRRPALRLTLLALQWA